jgi:5-methylcytosine-specific restriction endonuclease McrA
MDARLRQLVRERANGYCEYCRLAQEQEPLPFHIEHVVARQHRGPDLAANLALACHHCNLHKGTNLSGLDPQTGRHTRLFNPRQDRWDEHFTQEGGRIIGLTLIGRATSSLLRMNQDGRAQLRAGI